MASNDVTPAIGPSGSMDYKKLRTTAAGYLLSDAQATGFLGEVSYDYLVVTYPDAVTEVYTFKTGGSGGTTVRVITIVYTDSTKASLSTVTRTS